MYTHIFLVFAWKETWEISQHSLCVGEKLTFHCALFCTFWIFSRHFFVFCLELNGAWFSSRGIWKKWWETETRSHRHLPQEGEKQLLPQPAADFGSKVHNGPRWGPRMPGGWERARQQMFLSSHGTRWPTKPSSNPSFALLVWPWTHYLTSLGLLSSTVKCGENVSNSCGEG